MILYLCIMYYTVCYLTGIFYAVVRQISMFFIDNKISVFCILYENMNSNILDLGGRRGKSSTVTTTRHVTASQNWVENKAKTLLWHSDAKN